ncbi:MAG: 30S ribosomal protein S20 [Alphaproteobacteria bacterium]|jgi:small subunit ribosomal protein S20|nr:30S ribosomal protein S20 [Alphaproteobacteria bacterium]
MANHKSSKKRILRNAKREEINHARITRIRTFCKRVELAIRSGDKTAAADALKNAQPEIHRGVTKGVLHRNTAARKISRYSHRIDALS